MNYQNNYFSFSEAEYPEYTTEGISYKNILNSQNEMIDSDTRKECFTPVTSFNEYCTQKIPINHEINAESSKLNGTIQSEELTDIDEFTYNYLMNVNVSNLAYNSDQTYSLPAQLTENNASNDIIDVQWIEKRRRKTPKKKSSSPRKLNNEPIIPSNEFIILYENLIVHLQHPINLDFLKSIDFWRIPNNYTLESLHEFDKNLDNEKYRYLINVDNKTVDDLYLPKIIRILKKLKGRECVHFVDLRIKVLMECFLSEIHPSIEGI